MQRLNTDNYISFYKEKLSFSPYQYQLKVAESLLEGKNVILCVPTGCGKTWASVMPFLFALQNKLKDFPQKIIYSSPLRTLTNSIYEDVLKVTKTSTIQTGEYSEDKFFESEIIFSTIDQTLSNFLCFPLPLSHAQANINAGALIGSYLVFDEFHLLDTKLSMATTIGMLKMLGNLTRCCIMTATLNEKFMNDLKGNLTNFEIVTLDDFPNDKEKIGSLLPTVNKKEIEVIPETLSAENIADKHISKTIVICNKVETAQKIYQDLIKIIERDFSLKNIATENIICLHSRFFNNDRKSKENKLKSLFGKKCNKDEQAILIATQVVEAGMDLSCNVMHTELSPISSFLQRAGRCARFENETGKIFIYQILDSIDKVALETAINDEDKKEINRINNKYLPYKETDCTATLSELQHYKTLDGDIPKTSIENILGESEGNIISTMKAQSDGSFNQGIIRESWSSCNKNYYRSTIRDIQSVEITLINDEMIGEVARCPLRYQSLGMYKWSLVGWLNKILKGEGPIPFDEEDWLVMEMKEASDIFLENDENQKFDLVKVSPENFKNIPAQVYLNAKYFGYKEDFGFNWQYLNTFNFVSPIKDLKEKENIFKPLIKDTFYQHNKGLIGAFEKEFLPKMDFTFTELAKYLSLPEFKKEDFIRLITLMIILHDYGKLNDKWQKPMQKYQALKENYSIAFTEVLAHTDFDKKNPDDLNFEKLAALKSRPAHAGIGAFVAQNVMPDLYESEYLKSAIAIAIARHHNALSSSYPDFKIGEENYKAIQFLLDEFNVDVDLEKQDYRGLLDEFETSWHGEFIAYLFFVRILRLCDQKATENLSKYFNLN